MFYADDLRTMLNTQAKLAAVPLKKIQFVLQYCALPSVTTLSSTSFCTTTACSYCEKKKVRWNVQRYVPVSLKVMLCR